MTPEEKQKINRVIAEAMGWTWQAHSNDGATHYYRWHNPQGQNVGSLLAFNPVDSISDAMEGVDKIADGKYYSIEIQYHPFASEKYERFGVFLKIERFFKGGGSRIIQTLEFAETPAAAIALALAEYLKKPEETP